MGSERALLLKGSHRQREAREDITRLYRITQCVGEEHYIVCGQTDSDTGKKGDVITALSGLMFNWPCSTEDKSRLDFCVILAHPACFNLSAHL